jgi:alpha-galactosidase
MAIKLVCSARGLRNIPVFKEMAINIEKYSPNAIVLNYTNPMSTLTKVFYKVSSLKTVGLCHGLFEVYSLLMRIFSLETEDEIKIRFGGTNHFFWVTELKIRGEDGYDMLRKKMNGRPFAELVTEVCTDEAGFHSNIFVCSELFDSYGYLPYIADRHISEFVPHYLIGDMNRIDQYNIKRTSIKDRRVLKEYGRSKLDNYLQGKEKLSEKRSRETAADIIAAFINGKEFIDVVNLPNEGQISNLPKGSIVETLGVINSVGFTPVSTGNLPEQIINLVLPHVRNQDLIVEAGLAGDFDQAMFALYNDPLCSHLALPEIKEMGTRLLKAHKQFLPHWEL